MSKTEHSPLPWTPDNNEIVIKCPDGAKDIWVLSSTDTEDRDFIITACNSYYEHKQAIAELVEALERVVTQINDYERANNLAPNPPRTECWDCVADAKALIAKHKAKP